MKQKVKYKGILFIVLSALCFAFMNMFVRMAGDLPAVQKSFFRNLVAFIIALATMVRHKEVFQVEKGNWKYMILRAGFGTLGILCNFYVFLRVFLFAVIGQLMPGALLFGGEARR